MILELCYATVTNKTHHFRTHQNRQRPRAEQEQQWSLSSFQMIQLLSIEWLLTVHVYSFYIPHFSSVITLEIFLLKLNVNV